MATTLTPEELPLIKTYEWDRQLEDLREVDKRPVGFVRDGRLYVSGEEGDGFIDYYGEFRGGDLYIHPALVAWAEQHGGYWEWENAGCIFFVED